MTPRIVPTLVVMTLLASASRSVWANANAPDSIADDTAREAGDRAAECPGTLHPDEPQDPRTLTSYGVACFESGDHARAYVLYRKAYEQSKSPFLVAAMGRTLHEVGLYSVARRYYERFLRQASEDDAAATRKIRQRLDQLDSETEKSSSELVLGSTPGGADAYVQLDSGAWVPLGETPLQMDVRPGTWSVRLDRDGYIRQERRLTLRAGASHREQIPMISITSEFRHRGRTIKRAGLLTTLGSIPLFGASALFWGLAENDFNRQTFPATQFENRGRRRRAAAIGLVSAGTVGLASGLILWFRGDALAKTSEEPPADPDQSDSEQALQIRPRLSPTGAVLELNW